MILDRITLTNFRCFDRLVLNLDRHLNVFVGENGSGKSTILQAIAIGLAPVLDMLPFTAATGAEGVQRPTVPRIQLADIQLIKDDQSAPLASIMVVARDDEGGQRNWTQTITYQVPKRIGPKEKSHLLQVYDLGESLVLRHNNGQPYLLPIFAFYGTDRAVDLGSSNSRDEKLPQFFRRLAGMENALHPAASLQRAVGWFDYLERRELRERRDSDEQTTKFSAFDAVRQAIAAMIDGISNPRIDGATGRFVVDYLASDGGRIQLFIDQLSDGYQVLLGVVMDFAIRLALASPPGLTAKEILASEAILIIDEVDLHLHPAWQQRVVPRLRQTFPNTQIILTTHSPQVLSTVDARYIRQIARVGETTTTTQPPYQTRGVGSATVLATAMNVDQIPDVPEARKLSEYHNLIAQGTYDTAEGRQLRAELDAHFGPTHQLIIDLDRLIRFHEFKQRVAREKVDHASA